MQENIYLSGHILIHSGVKSHKCKDCEATFTQKGDLGRHVKAVHKGEKPHEFSVCKKTFSNKSDLTRHNLVCVSCAHLHSEGKLT